MGRYECPYCHKVFYVTHCDSGTSDNQNVYIYCGLLDPRPNTDAHDFERYISGWNPRTGRG
jgi:hypothetical protein